MNIGGFAILIDEYVYELYFGKRPWVLILEMAKALTTEESEKDNKWKWVICTESRQANATLTLQEEDTGTNTDIDTNTDTAYNFKFLLNQAMHCSSAATACLATSLSVESARTQKP